MLRYRVGISPVFGDPDGPSAKFRRHGPRASGEQLQDLVAGVGALKNDTLNNSSGNPAGVGDPELAPGKRRTY